MNDQLVSNRLQDKPKISWVKILLFVLIIEKIIQHTFVSLAFYFDWKGIGSTVVVNPDVLMVLGAIIGLMFIFCLWAMLTRRRWTTNLVLALAALDIIGEFIAQGRIDIVITVSFLVAMILLVLALIIRRQEQIMKVSAPTIGA